MAQSDRNHFFSCQVFASSLPEVRQNVLLCLDFMQLRLELNDGRVQTKRFLH